MPDRSSTAAPGLRANTSPSHGLHLILDVTRQSTFLIVLITIVVAAAGCNINHERVRFTFDNRTDSLICYYLNPEGAEAGRCNQKIKPLAKTAWEPGCGYGAHPERLPLTVILTVAERGRRIYDRMAECQVWQNSDRTFVIEKHGTEFVVADGLPDGPPNR